MERELYTRFTEMMFEREREADVRELWDSAVAKQLSYQPGFQTAMIFLRPGEALSTCWAFTVWDSEEDFERFYTGDHDNILGPIKNSGLRRTNRDELELLQWFLPTTKDGS